MKFVNRLSLLVALMLIANGIMPAHSSFLGDDDGRPSKRRKLNPQDQERRPANPQDQDGDMQEDLDAIEHYPEVEKKLKITFMRCYHSEIFRGQEVCNFYNSRESNYTVIEQNDEDYFLLEFNKNGYHDCFLNVEWNRKFNLLFSPQGRDLIFSRLEGSDENLLVELCHLAGEHPRQLSGYPCFLSGYPCFAERVDHITGLLTSTQTAFEKRKIEEQNLRQSKMFAAGDIRFILPKYHYNFIDIPQEIIQNIL